MKPIEDLLRLRTGLDVSAIGPESFQRLIRLRMKKAGVKDIGSYRHLVESSGSEWEELVESVVVTETCFFREREPFSAFIHLFRSEWLPTHPVETLHILSVPCASGEEPYSVAMTLADAGFPQNRFQIDGIDISRKALEQARRGVYRNNSFRGVDMTFRDRYFTRRENGFLLNPSLRQNVHLRYGNLLDDVAWNPGVRYDYIFCRNLLIYFDAVAQKRAFARLRLLLNPAGVLFVGPAEIPLALEMGFSNISIPRAFACRAWPECSELPLRSRTHSAMLPAAEQGSVVMRRAGSADLIDAGRLADEGKLKEAAEICHAYLRQHKASAHAYYLLGLVHDADRQPEASDYYHKALFLEPDHYETLWQLALMAQNNGELTRACALKQRAERARVRKPITL